MRASFFTIAERTRRIQSTVSLYWQRVEKLKERLERQTVLQKNLMIAATKRLPGDRPGQTPAGQQAGTAPGPARTEAAALKVRELAAFYGIKSQALARQFYFDLGT